MNKLTRNQASIIFKARTRMLNIKSNYKNGNKDNLKCRMCEKEEETQEHVLEDCEKLIHTFDDKIYIEEIFSENTTKLIQTAKKIEERIEKIQNSTEIIR